MGKKLTLMSKSGFLIIKKVALMYGVRTYHRLGYWQEIHFDVWNKNIPEIGFLARS